MKTYGFHNARDFRALSQVGNVNGASKGSGKRGKHGQGESGKGPRPGTCDERQSFTGYIKVQ